MPRERDPRRDEAFEIYKQSNGQIKLKDIAYQLDVSEGTIRGWKNKDSWTKKTNGTFQSKIRNVPKKRGGGQPGNKNAVGNNGGAPKKNQNAKVHGFFSKFLPADTLEIIESMNERPPADLIWDQIQIQYAAIIRAQQIMFVENKDDLVKVLKRQKESDKGWEKEYELQFSWDRHASFLNAQSRAMGELRSLIKQFEELANADDERRLKLEQMQIGIEKSKVELGNLRGDTEGDAHEQTNSYVEALNAQVESVFDDEVLDDEEA